MIRPIINVRGLLLLPAAIMAATAAAAVAVMALAAIKLVTI